MRVVAVKSAEDATLIPSIIVDDRNRSGPLEDWWGNEVTHSRNRGTTLAMVLENPAYEPFDLLLPSDWRDGYLTARGGEVLFVYGDPPRDWWKEWDSGGASERLS